MLVWRNRTGLLKLLVGKFKHVLGDNLLGGETLTAYRASVEFNRALHITLTHALTRYTVLGLGLLR